jgi:hypothetical protein
MVRPFGFVHVGVRAWRGMAGDNLARLQEKQASGPTCGQRKLSRHNERGRQLGGLTIHKLFTCVFRMPCRAWAMDLAEQIWPFVGLAVLIGLVVMVAITIRKR